MYALNNPLRFVDPSGYKYGPTDYEREMINGEHTYYNWEMSWKLGGNRTPFANAFEWGQTIGGWSYNWATGQYDNKFSRSSMSAYDYSSLVLPFYLQASGASTITSTNIIDYSYSNGFLYVTHVPTASKLISNMQMWFNPSLGTMLQYDKSANEFYVPHTTTTFSSYLEGVASGLDELYSSLPAYINTTPNDPPFFADNTIELLLIPLPPIIKSVRLARIGKGMKFPGLNPAKAPKGFKWRGKPGSQPGSKEGNWFNSRTGESLRPDLDHPGPIGSHWDYRDSNGIWWRLFRDGRKIPK